MPALEKLKDDREERWADAAATANVPVDLADSLAAYVSRHLPPGAFLAAVLSNDLREAVLRADPRSMAAMKQIVNWVVWEVPSGAWGSREKVAAWIRMGEETA